MIDLRLANWVKRREEAGPKTIEEIHKDAQKEEIKQKLANMTTEPPPSRKSEDRSNRRWGYDRPARGVDIHCLVMESTIHCVQNL